VALSTISVGKQSVQKGKGFFSGLDSLLISMVLTIETNRLRHDKLPSSTVYMLFVCKLSTRIQISVDEWKL
jgi:hypothetical protein